MNVLDAAARTVRDYPGGSLSLAPRLGKRPGTLSHEVNPPEGGSAKLGLLDAIDIIKMSRDYRIIHATCAELGGMFIKLPVIDDAQGDPGSRMAAVAKEFADLMGEVCTSSADGEISDNDIKRIEREWAELMAAGQVLLAYLQARNEEVHARHG